MICAATERAGIVRDTCSLDLFWLRDESLEDSANLPAPEVIAEEIADHLRSAPEHAVLTKTSTDRIDFDERLWETYARGRRMSPETARLWMDHVARRTAGLPVRRVLDLGCGTGRFAPHLAERLGARVVGVEPSERMLGVARRERAHPRVAYVLGDATRIPLRDAACDVAWLSMVLHHVPDLVAAARELRRVVVPGGMVLVRGSYRGRLASFLMYRFFPSALAADEARLPAIGDVRRRLDECGFEESGFEEVEQTLDPDLTAHVERLRLRATSSFDFVPEDEFAAGIRAMEEAATRGEFPGPVRERIDLLTFVRRR